MHADADEHLCEACVDDAFLEPYLQMLYVDFLQAVYRRCTDFEHIVYLFHILCKFDTYANLIV